MTEISPNDPRLKKLQLDNLLSYLQASGWELLNHPNDRAWVFSGPLDDEGRPFKLMLPRQMSFQDAPLRVADAINVLAGLQEQPPDEVLQAIDRFIEPATGMSEMREAKNSSWNWQDWLSPLAAAASLAVCVISLLQGRSYLYLILSISLFLIALNSLLLTRTMVKLKYFVLLTMRRKSE